MEIVSHFFKRTVPTFFETLPIPESFVGFADLNGALTDFSCFPRSLIYCRTDCSELNRVSIYFQLKNGSSFLSSPVGYH